MKFTIGIPAFKSIFFEECINSILVQTYSDFELIIINDASPDPIEEIVFRYNDKRIKYFKNDFNIGAKEVVKNWNKCLELATGDYFILMGDDDKLDPKFLFEFDLLIQKYPDLNVFHCRSKIIDSQSNVIDITPSWPEYENIYDNILHRIKGFRIQYISDFVYNTSALKKNGGFYMLPLAWGSDDLTAYQQMGSQGIAHTNSFLLNYRNSPVTISNSGNINLKLLAIEAERKWFDSFISSAHPTGIEIVLLNRINKILPDYFSNKIKYTLKSAFKKNFMGGIRLTINEIYYKRMTFNEGIAVFLSALKFWLK